MYNAKAKYCTLVVTLTLITAVLVQIVQADTPRVCPNFCKCDLYDERNRADCSAKRLISPNLEISPAVEILDLSYNDITTLDNSCFQAYTYLLNLTLAHNAIHTIDLDAFSRLRRLNALDLTYNRLEDVDERLLEMNRQLHQLNLEGNKFMTLPNKPLLRSKSLQTLNLRNSQINFMHSELLSALPQLQQLDISQNLMITLDSSVFNALANLRQLNLQENRWICDQTLMASVKMLQQRGVEVNFLDCKVAATITAREVEIQQFERMEMLSSGEPHRNDSSVELLMRDEFSEESIEQGNKSQTASTIASNKWRVPAYHNEDDGDVGDIDDDSNADTDYPMSPIRITPDGYVCEGSRKLLCLLYGKCLQKLMETMEKDAKDDRNGVYTKSDLNLAFLLGCAAGITTVVFIVSCAMCFKACYEERRRNRVHLEETYAAVPSIPHRSQPIYSRPIPLPPPPPAVPTRSRRSRHSRRSTQTAPEYSPNAVVQHDPANDNFFSRLFGRPTRHQYYRTLNQNTATLIRRLSRSNLFNNRLSQHFAERQRSNGSDVSSAGQSPNDPHVNQFDYEIASERVNEPARPETPPPNYGDVVANHKC